ncbi:LacI family DNA-binding transcriptional regulator [Sphingobium sp. EP60837]|uniref:LacI family DNA-binding transcriptional regulator n=1 Tax=Sphingobium sp. EP60837 TaxID=1855519 RepID=UPI0018D33DE1|nr:LacI family DNA-binding transcriptional regulator [Sphingobium sp. EP60837]
MGDVAKHLGVSKMTVSRALNKPGRVSATMRERVLSAVEEIGYLPNQLASSLSSNRSMIVGLIVPSIENSIYTSTVAGLSQIMREAGCHVMIAESNNSPDEEEKLVTAFLAHRVGGLVLHGTRHTERAIKLIRASGVPVVENGNIPLDPLDMVVGFSNFDAAHAMTMHLGRLGYKHIALATLSSVNNDRAHDRVQGYRLALEELGHSPDPRLIIECGRGVTAGAEMVSHLVETAPEVDALFCAGDVIALGALFECQKRGWAVPERLAIASFDDVEILRHVTPAITTLRLPRGEIGVQSAMLLTSRMMGRADDARGRVIKLNFEIIQRGST